MTSAHDLLTLNRPWVFWQLIGRKITAEEWQAASREARYCLADLPAAKAKDLSETIGAVLGEGQFGDDHWQLSRSKQLYYAVRPLLPSAARPLLQRLAARGRQTGGLLRWPLEDRYVRFQFEMLRRLLVKNGLDAIPYMHFWPAGRRFALVLTHDVESERGQEFVNEVAALEERHGFRSSFNFVPEGYRVNPGLLAELRERGFEVGVHGLRHDGRLFSSLTTFERRVQSINEYLGSWQAVGFRAPLTNRNPVWMQMLEVEYDSSFFDTDPFEPIAGGTMSIWPFTMGRFVELPYTLPQDHTLMRTLRETTPRLWLEKSAFIRQCCGMVLVNSHPDYLLKPSYLAIYEEFLAGIRRLGGYWQALPMEVARWWRRRMEAPASPAADWAAAPDLPGGTIGRARLATASDDATSVQGLILEAEYQPAPALGVV